MMGIPPVFYTLYEVHIASFLMVRDQFGASEEKSFYPNIIKKTDPAKSGA
jgi:hypothetical protein